MQWPKDRQWPKVQTLTKSTNNDQKYKQWQKDRQWQKVQTMTKSTNHEQKTDNDKKYKQWSTKHYTKDKKNGYHVVRKGKQYLLVASVVLFL
jgi:hypothetical protein